MSTKLRFPQASSRRYLLRCIGADDVVPDLTGATVQAFLKRSVFDADEDALVDVSARVAIISGEQGLATFSLEPADTADLEPFLSLEWQVRFVLAGGSVFAHAEHQGPVVFAPMTGDPAIAEPDNAYVEEITAAMSSLQSIVSGLTGLYLGTSASLDGLSAALLAALPNGTVIAPRFTVASTHRLVLEYRLRAKATGEVDTPTSGRIVVCDNDTSRVWELDHEPSYDGQPCVWDDAATAWKPITGYGDAASLLPAITLPS